MNHYLIHLLRSSLVIVLLYTISASTLNAQKIKLVKDIRTLENPEISSNPATLMKAGDEFFFTAYQKETGRELWISDGTPNGTRMVKDLIPGIGYGLIQFELYHNNLLFFTFNNGTNGHELWRSDGTDAGTYIVKDINPGNSGSFPDNFVVCQDKMFFAATNDANQRDLWYTDGSTAGTQRYTLPKYYTKHGPFNIKVVDNAMYFLATHYEFKTNVLWKYNPLNQELILIDFPLPFTNELKGPISFVVIDKKIYLHATYKPYGPIIFLEVDCSTLVSREITLPNDETKLDDIITSSFTQVGDTIFFVATNKIKGSQLWILDINTLKANLITSFHISNTNYHPTYFKVYRNKLFFIGVDLRLWTSDGSSDGTHAVGTKYSSALTLVKAPLEIINDKLVFSATLNTQNILWFSDGTDTSTNFMEIYCGLPVYSNPLSIISFDSVIYFSGFDYVNGRELWKSDGTCEETMLVKNLYSNPGGSSPTNLVWANDKLFFTATDDKSGRELWSSGGKQESTNILFDFTYDPRKLTAPQHLTAQGKNVVFTSSYNNTDLESIDLWVSNGTTTGTKNLVGYGLQERSFIRFIPTEKRTFYIVLNQNNTHELWSTNGLVGGTHKIMESNNYVQFINITTDNKTTLFSFGGDLWTTDGTAAGTKSLKLRNNHCRLWYQTELETSNNITYFSALGNDSKFGGELWCRNGTTGEVKMVKDINPGANGTSISNFKAYKSRMLFQVDRNNQTELWITNGTEQGTYKIKDLLAQPRLDYIQLGDYMYFKSKNLFDIDNLWKTDGTPEGTTLITDYFWLTGASKITSMKAVNDYIFFSLENVDYGEELWRTDGTKEGTVIVEDLMPGKASSSPKELTAGNNVLYFSADHPTYGRELFYVKVPPSTHSNSEQTHPVKVYPNPATDILTVEFENHQPGETHTIILYDILGQKVDQEQTTLNPIRIETTSLTAGTYFLKADDVEVVKVVVY